MLQELSHMDRITQLQDEIQQVRRWLDSWGWIAHFQVALMNRYFRLCRILLRTSPQGRPFKYLQASPGNPVTKSRNPEKYDSPEVFEGQFYGDYPYLELTISITQLR
jgi:mediator of RNA polymerase II transcription subunit 21